MLKVEKDSLMHCEKEMNLKLESSEVSRREATVDDARIVELELDLRECMTERNDLRLRLKRLYKSQV